VAAAPGHTVGWNDLAGRLRVTHATRAKEAAVPVAIEMTFRGATLDQYDQVIELMGLQSGNIPPGAISHWVSGTDDGLRIVDVWESREVFDRFAQEQIGPYTQQVGITEPPEMVFRDVHNHLPRS
jgi:hypothetical protein